MLSKWLESIQGHGSRFSIFICFLKRYNTTKIKQTSWKDMHFSNQIFLINQTHMRAHTKKTNTKTWKGERGKSKKTARLTFRILKGNKFNIRNIQSNRKLYRCTIPLTSFQQFTLFHLGQKLTFYVCLIYTQKKEAGKWLKTLVDFTRSLIKEEPFGAPYFQ